MVQKYVKYNVQKYNATIFNLPSKLNFLNHTCKNMYLHKYSQYNCKQFIF